jgi:hypothetical protein
MAAETIAVLKAEIAGLERQLEIHRRALAILGGTASTAKAAPTTRPARTTAGRRRPRRHPTQPLAVRIESYLAAHRGQPFTPAQLAGALQKTDKRVSRDNVQRRLSDLAKAKKVKRENGRYTLPSA